MKILVATVVLLALHTTSSYPTKSLAYKEPTDGRILGGTETTPHSRPYEVYLVFTRYASEWTCGGALISTNYVLTAGHCVNVAISVKVVLGAHNRYQIEPTQVIYNSMDFILHDGYEKEVSKVLNDIGLVKLPESVTYTPEIQPIALPLPSDANASYDGETVTMSGWGLLNGPDYIETSVLMEVDVKVISLSTCQSFFPSVEVQAYQICTSGDDSKGACSGDSGSPLIYNNRTIGIVSYGISGCQYGYPTVFTSVGPFLNWIQENSDVKLG